jgi:hypothetical protein
MSLRAELREELYALTPEENLEARMLLESWSREYMSGLIARIDENRKGMIPDPDFDSADVIREFRENGWR